MKNIKKHVEDLYSQIEYHNYRYYVLDDPEIPDARHQIVGWALPTIEIDYYTTGGQCPPYIFRASGHLFGTVI